MIARGRWPTLEPVLHGKIRAGESSRVAERNAQSLCGERVILSEVLRHHGGAITGVGHRYESVSRLLGDEGFEIAPLAGGLGVERIVNQNGQVQIFAMAPIRDLHAFFALKHLHVFLFDRRRRTLLSDSRYGEGYGVGGVNRDRGQRSKR